MVLVIAEDVNCGLPGRVWYCQMLTRLWGINTVTNALVVVSRFLHFYFLHLSCLGRRQ